MADEGLQIREFAMIGLRVPSVRVNRGSQWVRHVSPTFWRGRGKLRNRGGKVTAVSIDYRMFQLLDYSVAPVKSLCPVITVPPHRFLTGHDYTAHLQAPFT